MNNTPRCDSLKNTDAGAWINLARQLERELAECSGKYDALVKILERKQDRIDVCERDLAEATRRLNEFEHPRDPIDKPKSP